MCGAVLLVPHRKAKLEDRPSSAVSDCSFTIFTTVLHNERPSPPPST
jgi:hypothetical protein